MFLDITTMFSVKGSPLHNEELNNGNLELQIYYINDSIINELKNSFSASNNQGYFDTTTAENNFTNLTVNLTTFKNTEKIPANNIMILLKMIGMALILGMMILITIIGNVFVIAAIILERNLQTVANYLVVSLAVADLFVACLVMPLGAVYEISDGWILGAELCDIWTSCDVLCCTASILHLVAIATDRYWTVTNIDYNNLRTPRRVFFMIFCVWIASLIVSLAPQFGWKDPEYMQRIEEHTCLVSQDVGYQIFATCCTFYVPLLVILFLYWKIYKIARKRIQRRTQKSFIASVNETECESAARRQVKQQMNKEQRKRRRLKICFGREFSGIKTKRTMATTYIATTDDMIGAVSGTDVVSTPTACPNKKSTLGTNINTLATDFTSMAITREETEFSTSNYDNKSHAGTELTTVSSDADDFRTSNASEIVTLSQQVASTTHQQTLLVSHLNAITPLTQGIAVGSCSKAVNSRGGLASIVNPHLKIAKRRQLLEAKRERKAAQTLAIITGAFVVCWLPFFVMALTLSLCKLCIIHPAVSSLFLWLGYFNSTLNPIIYTVFNPEFRRAFQRILHGHSGHYTGKYNNRSARI